MIRSAGREDADVILIGELRTNETMKLALQLASFGVLVFGTVHTNSAAATIDRIINAFPTDEQLQVRGMLSESLAAIIAQQLLRTKDGTGRVAAHEILVGSSALSSMIIGHDIMGFALEAFLITVIFICNLLKLRWPRHVPAK